MNWVLLTLFSAIIVEALIRLPVVRLASHIALLSRRSVRTLRADGVSDHWKEKAMGEYSLRTFKSTLQLLATFLALAATGLIFVFFAEQIHEGFSEFLLSGTGIVASSVIATAFAIARTKWIKGSD